MYLISQVGFDPDDVEQMPEEDMRHLALSLLNEDTQHAAPPSNPLPDTPIDISTPQHDLEKMQVESANDQLLQSFCEMTGSDVESARVLLEASDWDVSTAITMHMAQGEGQESSRESSSPRHLNSQPLPSMTRTTLPEMAFNPGFPHPIAADPMAHLHAMASSFEGFHGFNDDMDIQPTPNQPMFDEHGIRRPDPVRVSRLLGDNVINTDFARADEPNVEWLFPPPRHISFPGNFQEARALAKQEKKWILVNIQSHEEFGSHQLNRDTWVDDTIQEILRENFVFWQRGHTSMDGKNYMALYHILAEDLPHIGIIDPRTGAKITTIRGYMDPRILTQTLFEFFDENSLDSMKAGKHRIRSSGSYHETITVDDSEDEKCEDGKHLKELKVDESLVDERETKKPREDATSDVRKPVTYGPIPPEPTGNPNRANVLKLKEDLGDDMTKVSIKLANGRSLVRKYRKSDYVQVLYAVAQANVPEANSGRAFDLVTNFPRASLSDRLNDTLVDSGVANSQVIMEWV